MIVLYLKRRSRTRIDVVVLWAGEAVGNFLKDHAGRCRLNEPVEWYSNLISDDVLETDRDLGEIWDDQMALAQCLIEDEGRVGEAKKDFNTKCAG